MKFKSQFLTIEKSSGTGIFSAHMEAPDSFWGKISGAIIGFFTSASVLKLVVSGLIFALIALTGAYACIRKQERIFAHF